MKTIVLSILLCVLVPNTFLISGEASQKPYILKYIHTDGSEMFSLDRGQTWKVTKGQTGILPNSESNFTKPPILYTDLQGKTAFTMDGEWLLPMSSSVIHKNSVQQPNRSAGNSTRFQVEAVRCMSGGIEIEVFASDACLLQISAVDAIHSSRTSTTNHQLRMGKNVVWITYDVLNPTHVKLLGCGTSIILGVTR